MQSRNENFMPGLSKNTKLLVEKMFVVSQQKEVCELLQNQCGNNLPFCENLDEHQLERFRFAVLKLSKGHLDELIPAIISAQEDWRDTLMAAGFGESVTEHEEWAKVYLSDS